MQKGDQALLLFVTEVRIKVMALPAADRRACFMAEVKTLAPAKQILALQFYLLAEEIVIPMAKDDDKTTLDFEDGKLKKAQGMNSADSKDFLKGHSQVKNEQGEATGALGEDVSGVAKEALKAPPPAPPSFWQKLGWWRIIVPVILALVAWGRACSGVGESKDATPSPATSTKPP